MTGIAACTAHHTSALWGTTHSVTEAIKRHTSQSYRLLYNTAIAACKADLTTALCGQVLPNSLTSLPRLSMLLLAGCPRLGSLPPNFAALSALEWLDLFGCERLQALPQQVSNFLQSLG